MSNAPVRNDVERQRAYRTRSKPLRGEISLRNAKPMVAAAIGNRPLLYSSRRAKLTKIPCAVSGRKKLSQVTEPNGSEREKECRCEGEGECDYIPSALTRRTNLRLEHEVELVGRGDVVAGLRSLGVVLGEVLVQLGGVHVAGGVLDARVLGKQLLREAGLGQQLVHAVLEQMVGSMADTGLHVLDHKVLELGNVARGTADVASE